MAKVRRLDGTYKLMGKDLNTVLAMHEYTQDAIRKKIAYLEYQIEKLGQSNAADGDRVQSLVRRLKRQGFKPSNKIKSYADASSWLYKEISRLLRVGHHASEQSIIALAVLLDDFIRRTIHRYYKDDANRVLFHKQNILSNGELVEAVQRQWDISALLAHRVTDQILRKPFQRKLEELSRIINHNLDVNARLRLLVYIRNSLVHNKGRVSKDLAEYAADKYSFNREITVTDEDVYESAIAIRGFCTYVRNKFDKAYPRQEIAIETSTPQVTENALGESTIEELEVDTGD